MSHVIQALVTCPQNYPEIITDLPTFCAVPIGFCHNDLKHNIELLDLSFHLQCTGVPISQRHLGVPRGNMCLARGRSTVIVSSFLLFPSFFMSGMAQICL